MHDNTFKQLELFHSNDSILWGGIKDKYVEKEEGMLQENGIF